ncbi:DOMON-like domain-containing protein [Sphingomonas mesophila]|uniref:DOMON-like domain-containing protein n=1 Tax=Sphingomonas mesophila TaxID=2303576 RepID=UPI000E5969A5|nr:DOMON-like domain-containing protein [Sphingomonas mesophila]
MRRPLICHPQTPLSGEPFDLWATAELSAAFGASATLNIWFGVGAPAARFVVPPPGEGARRDELWSTTCFEAFLASPGEAAYREWNFAPSGDWAAYDFDDYRAGMRPADIAAPPYIRLEDNLTWWTLGGTIAVPADAQWQLGLSAVIEERDGAKSFWAMAHPEGAPDFHHRSCFAATLSPIA